MRSATILLCPSVSSFNITTKSSPMQNLNTMQNLNNIPASGGSMPVSPSHSTLLTRPKAPRSSVCGSPTQALTASPGGATAGHTASGGSVVVQSFSRTYRSTSDRPQAVCYPGAVITLTKQVAHPAPPPAHSSPTMSKVKALASPPAMMPSPQPQVPPVSARSLGAARERVSSFGGSSSVSSSAAGSRSARSVQSMQSARSSVSVSSSTADVTSPTPPTIQPCRSSRVLPSFLCERPACHNGASLSLLASLPHQSTHLVSPTLPSPPLVTLSSVATSPGRSLSPTWTSSPQVAQPPSMMRQVLQQPRTTSSFSSSFSSPVRFAPRGYPSSIPALPRWTSERPLMPTLLTDGPRAPEGLFCLDRPLACGLSEEEALDLMSRELTPEDFEKLCKLDESVPRRNTAQKDLVERLPKVLGRDLAAKGCSDCGICLLPLPTCAFAKELPCKHAFHAACISKWLTQFKNTCPLCNAPIEKCAEERP